MWVFSGYREKLYVRCKQLKREGVFKDVFTRTGDVTVLLVTADGDTEEIVVTSEKEIDELEAKLRNKAV